VGVVLLPAIGVVVVGVDVAGGVVVVRGVGGSEGLGEMG
jgi:hypothetical protein